MFLVRVLTEGNPGLGRIVRKFDSYKKAKEYANDVGRLFDRGVVIYDSVRQIVDYGDDQWASARDCTKLVDEPFYARRVRESRPRLA
ncbi:MAG TPA: hypothetical protein PKX69_10710 [Limnochordia bacterium]|nr:hypothetical protein [Limnochordia bacterium]